METQPGLVDRADIDDKPVAAFAFYIRVQAARETAACL